MSHFARNQWGAGASVPPSEPRVSNLPKLVKVRAHAGESYDEVADRVADIATHDDDVPLLWSAPSGRIIYQFTPHPTEPEETLYTASMNDTDLFFIKDQAALSSLYPSRSSRVMESFLRRLHSSRDLLGYRTRHSPQKLRIDSCNQ